MKKEWKAAASISCNLAVLSIFSVMLYKLGGGTLLSAALACGVLGTALSQRTAPQDAQKITVLPEHGPE